MDSLFSVNDVSILFKYALHQQRNDAAGVAIKVAEIINTDCYKFLCTAIKDSSQDEISIANGLTHFARFNQLNLIIGLLQNNSIKIKLAAILCLQLLRDPRALNHLSKLINDSGSKIVREKATLAFKKIEKEPVQLIDNKFYTSKNLTSFDDADLVLAYSILNRDLTNIQDKILVKQLFHPLREIRNFAEEALLKRGQKILNSVIETVVKISPPITIELMNVLGNYNDPRWSQLIINWLKNNNDLTYYKAIEILGSIGGEEAALFLSEIIIKKEDCAYEIEALKKTRTIPVVYFLSEYKNNNLFRQVGAERLAAILGVDALHSLLDAIHDRFRIVRENAELGLTKLGQLVSESLIELLNSSNDDDLRLQICRILGNIGDIRALKLLNESALSKNKYLHWTCIKSIGQIVDPLSVNILSQWIDSKDLRTRILAFQGLGHQGQIEAVEVLISKVNDTDQEVRLVIIKSLYNLANKLNEALIKIMPILLSLVKDQNKDVAFLAENILADLENKHKKVYMGAGLFAEIVNMPLSGILFSTPLQDIIPYPKTEIPLPITDNIQFSVSAPRIVCPGRSFILDVWAHFSEEQKMVAQLAREAQRNKPIFLRSKGPIQIQRDTTLNVRITIPDFNIMLVDTIYWGGSNGNCTFPINVPEKMDVGYYLGSANFYVGSILVAKLSFDIEVGQIQQADADISTREQRIKTAFASYASIDREKVLGRIQGMLKLLPTFDIFLDVASLRSGDKWENRLEQEISSRDIFYLFWSSAASKSAWVEKEWRTALLTKGIDSIDPVPLESPQNVPPPPELSSLHFNEWTLAFQK